ncbi:MAG: hypothetical protein E7063_00975 [Spirochaetaceae bacterium]|nr:hypothetical protein [Spirochaetaceae bacterium]
MKKPLTFVSVLYMIIFFLLAVIILGTIIVYAVRHAAPGKDLRQADPSPEELSEQFGTFTEMGQIRTFTASDSNSSEVAALVIEPWFSYESKDIAFYEELSGKRRKIQSIIVNYFNQRTFATLKSLGESYIKDELLEMINQELVMGSISALYFETYLFIETEIPTESQ